METIHNITKSLQNLNTIKIAYNFTKCTCVEISIFALTSDKSKYLQI